MTFVFYHHEPFGPLELSQLHAGEAVFGGSVARLRLLFHIAKRGHTVVLTGNVIAGEYRGVLAQSLDDTLRSSAVTEGPTVVVLNNPPPTAAWEALRARVSNANVRYVVWAGNDLPHEWRERLVRGEVHRAVCVSHWHRDAYRLYPGFEAIEASYSGIDKEFLPSPRPRKEVFVYFASVPRISKGFHHVLAAWPLVRAQVPHAELRVSGGARMHEAGATLGKSGVLDSELEAQFPELFADPPRSLTAAGIQLMGPRPLPEVYRDIARASVAIVNCDTRSPETYCRAAVESQAAGTPVVGVAAGSLPEVIANGRTGLLASNESPTQIADALIRLLTDERLRARMSEDAPRWADWLADYDLIAPDWEGIAERAFTGVPAPAAPRPLEDRLRRLGYGKLRPLLQRVVPRRLVSWVRGQKP
jgi:glycosyltransferase involved in cell wall biosynthesis